MAFISRFYKTESASLCTLLHFLALLRTFKNLNYRQLNTKVQKVQEMQGIKSITND